jgi:hypothetical protein
MKIVRIAALLAALAPLALAAQVEERHCQERGTGAIHTRSAFAHGYRHGYEAGYHEGNIDINMARRPRTQFKQFKGLPLGYQDSFGPKKSFEFGFALGLKAGYSDGYAGNRFRAVDGLRWASNSLGDEPIPVDPQNTFFDRGVTLGYQDGFARGQSEPKTPLKRRVALNSVPCTFHPSKPRDAAAEPSYCEGYRRGYVLGHGDGLAVAPDQGLLEASK